MRRNYGLVASKVLFSHELVVHWRLMSLRKLIRLYYSFRSFPSDLSCFVSSGLGLFQKRQLIIIIIMHTFVYVSILWLSPLPVYNDYCKYNKAGLPWVQQCMLYLYLQLLQPQGYTYSDVYVKSYTRFTLYSLDNHQFESFNAVTAQLINVMTSKS